MTKEIRNLRVNEKYILIDDREIYEVEDEEIYTEKQLEEILFKYYDLTEHWAILTNRHPDVTLTIETIFKPIEKLGLMQWGKKRSVVYSTNIKTGEAKILLIDNDYLMFLDEMGLVL